ncbi:MAG TPA: hypothetical protein VKA27_02960 [Sunxiuqinia sp.]|nr:hypothetical protein [Sunxiuqinia sp.]
MRLAVIDLGTNTSNLLVAEIKNENFDMLYQGKIGVKLGKGGIHRNQLTNEAFERAKKAFLAHKEKIQELQANEVKVIATSAVRDAANKTEFSNYLLEQTGLQLEIISGDREAEFIFKGVQLAFGNLPNNTLILDIGGGSNEFIQTQNNQVHWKESFPLGMARVLEQFQLSDPITKDEIEAVENYFRSGLTNLWKQLKDQKVAQLVGCAGAFDTITDLIDQTAPGTKARQSQEISLQNFQDVCERVIYSTKKQREQMIGMEPLRVEMIVPALIFIRHIINELGIKTVIQTDFALREGVLSEWINH